VKLLALLLLPVTVAAQTPYTVPIACIPGITTTALAPTEPEIRWNTVGICVRWECIDRTTIAVVKAPHFCGTWAEFSRVPARIATIRGATDPIKSASDAGKRYTIVPLTDPSMAGMPK
jgi:hypothetical protein